jgi:hypothetical protein
MRGNKMKRFVLIIVIIAIIIIASVYYTKFYINHESKNGNNNEKLYYVNYTKSTAEFNESGEWVGEGNESFVFPILFENITKIEFYLNWTLGSFGLDIPQSKLNMSIYEPPNSTLTFIPSNSSENESWLNGGYEGSISIICLVNNITAENLINASSEEDAINNTTISNGSGNWHVNISGIGNNGPWAVTIEWELTVNIHYYNGTIEGG